MFQRNLTRLLYLTNIDDEVREAIFIQCQIIEDELKSSDSENKKITNTG